MLTKILGHAKITDMLRQLSGGPQSVLPMSPTKGSGVPNASGLSPKRPRSYVTPMQKPNWTVPKATQAAPRAMPQKVSPAPQAAPQPIDNGNKAQLGPSRRQGVTVKRKM